jgi:hypothetical protein
LVAKLQVKKPACLSGAALRSGVIANALCVDATGGAVDRSDFWVARNPDMNTPAGP